MFCRYCGKEIEDGNVCQCRILLDSPKQEDIPKEEQKTSENNKMIIAYFQEMLCVLKEAIIGFFKAPYDSISKVYADKNGNYPFVIGAIFLIIAMITSLVFTNNSAETIKISFICVLVLVIEKCFFSGLIYLFNKEDGADFKQVLKVTLYTCIQPMMCLVLVLLFNAMGVISGVLIAIICYVFSDIVMGGMIASVVFQNKNKAHWVYMLNSFIMIILGYIIIKNIVSTVIESVMSDLSWLL